MFRQRVPPWIPLGGLALSGAAGCINAIGFLSVNRQGISHMSGNVTNVGIHLVAADYSTAITTALVIGSFFAGCVLSGFIIRQSTLRLGRRYGVALVIESLLLLASTWYLRHGAALGDYLAALACGLQNAMAATYSGAVIRTTHMTGMVTDLGLALGHWARGDQVEWPRMRLYLMLLLGFFTGSTAGALGFQRFGTDTLLFPAILCGLSGLVYTAYCHWRQPSAPAP